MAARPPYRPYSVDTLPDVPFPLFGYKPPQSGESALPKVAQKGIHAAASSPSRPLIKRLSSISFRKSRSSNNLAASTDSAPIPKKSFSWVKWMRKMFADKSSKAIAAVQETFQRLNSKTPKEKLPKTWEDYTAAYARGDIDVLDPPLPPQSVTSSLHGDTNPYETQSFPGPLPAEHKYADRTTQRIDPYGKWGHKLRSTSSNESLSAAATLDNHPVFREIVAEARKIFQSSISILTVFTDDQQLFLAETGLGGMKEVPREVTFCSHAVLQRPIQPFQLLDAQKDWRFAKSPLVVKYGSRSYYGVPLVVPTFSTDKNAPENIPIGTLCVIDNAPRESFTNEQREQMAELADRAQLTIQKWSQARLKAKVAALESSHGDWQKEASSVMSASSSTSSVNVAQSEPEKHMTNGTELKEAENVDITEAAPVQEVHSQTVEAPVALKSSMKGKNKLDGRRTSALQSVMDLSTRLIGSTLELDLVYIVALHLGPKDNPSIPPTSADAVTNSEILSAHNLPEPHPSLDALLHLKALRAPEGGLLYQNPDKLDMEEAGGYFPSMDADDNAYASALIVPITEFKGVGYVLSGFTSDGKRVFGKEDLLYMRQISTELAQFIKIQA